MPSPLHPVQSFPRKLRTRDGRELLARPLGREAGCARCKRERTVVQYVDHRARRGWPICYTCGLEVLRGQEPAGEWEPYPD